MKKEEIERIKNKVSSELAAKDRQNIIIDMLVALLEKINPGYFNS